MTANAKKDACGTLKDTKVPSAKPLRESKELVSALRKELRSLVEDDALGHNLERISVISKRAADLVMALRSPEETWKKHRGHTLIPSFGGGVSPDFAEEFGSSGYSIGSGTATTMPSPTAMGVETYGSSVIKQILPALKEYQQAMKETPQTLVDAIATARRMGMTDVAAELEKKLCGKSLDGERPIGSGFVTTIDDYLPPKAKTAIGESSQAIEATWSTPVKTNGKSKSKETAP